MKNTESIKLLLSKYDFPPLNESVHYIKSLEKKTVYELLREATLNERVLIQPRCGLGDHRSMKNLLQDLEAQSRPDILTLTIDSYTRLCHFDTAGQVLKENPQNLNGYPLVNHGWRCGRELNEAIKAPLEIRHGSPDARVLFEVALASGITSFEGGGICYNLPYCKNIPLSESLEYWRYIDRQCGELVKRNIIMDRELFGTLTAVLMPPSICLAMTLLEAISAAQEGVRCISVAYCQGGHLFQDIAAMRAIKILFRKYLPNDVEIYPVLHEFMGAFPKARCNADAIIFLGGLVAKRGHAVKLINKTYDEAFGIPTLQANNAGVWTARTATTDWFDFIDISEERINEEMAWILTEVEEIIQPIIEQKDIYSAIFLSFENGSLDIPFSASRYAHSKIIPMRDVSGAIRYYEFGNVPMSAKTKQRNHRLLTDSIGQHDRSLFKKMEKDIFYLCKYENQEQGVYYDHQSS